MMKLDPMKALETTARMKPVRLSENDASIFLKDESIKHNFHPNWTMIVNQKCKQYIEN